MANNRSKQLLKEHFQELEGEREVNSSGSDDEEDEDQVRKRKWPVLSFFSSRGSKCAWFAFPRSKVSVISQPAWAAGAIDMEFGVVYQR